MKVNKIFLYFLLLLAIGFLIVIFYFRFYNLTNVQAGISKVIINNIVINVEVAQTSAELAKGLGQRDYLAKNTGMLFDLGKKQIPVFWMKDMQFPLDIIWINDNQIIDIHENVPVVSDESQLISYKPQKLANYVLEVNSGFIDKNNIKIGDQVLLQ